MSKPHKSCEVCSGVEKLRYTVTRCGLKEDYRKQSTFSSFAHYCPKCGRNISPWVKEGDVKS